MSTPRDLIVDLAIALNREGISHTVVYSPVVDVIRFTLPDRKVQVSAQQRRMGDPAEYQLNHTKMVENRPVATHTHVTTVPILTLDKAMIEVRKAIATNPFSN